MTSTRGRVLFDLANAAVYRFGSARPTLENVVWRWWDGETHAIVGGMASGKSTLTEVLEGKHRVWPPETRTFYFPPESRIRRIAFKEEGNSIAAASYGRLSYQLRYHSQVDEDISLREMLIDAGAGADQRPEQRMMDVAKLMEVDTLLDRSFIHLSSGQVRRARITKALLEDPAVLILDEPFMGLDVKHREVLSNTINTMIQEPQRWPRVLLVLRPQDEIPSAVTHIIELGKKSHNASSTTVFFGPLGEYATSRRRSLEESARSNSPTLLSKPEVSGDPIVELKNVKVGTDTPILRDINWTIREGERWALLGPNGSGKSTLLSLIVGDNPQAYANEIKLFGHQRGEPGQTIWDIKRDIGLVSTEIHQYFKYPLTALQTVHTGFFDIFLLPAQELTPAQITAAADLFNFFNVNHLSERKFSHLSTGEQRLILFIRALVKKPKLLVLDESFQGFDQEWVRKAKEYIDTMLDERQTVLFVSHHREEVPLSVTKVFRLDEGRGQPDKL
ncbi:P-loop containing nucleoside triphosphate hydrolase protein [Cladochytrium replicatum]|nr:P-loop containing nucleoside triphosphate hydrolase protein [Cladochytrium replicatum]